MNNFWKISIYFWEWFEKKMRKRKEKLSLKTILCRRNKTKVETKYYQKTIQKSPRQPIGRLGFKSTTRWVRLFGWFFFKIWSRKCYIVLNTCFQIKGEKKKEETNFWKLYNTCNTHDILASFMFIDLYKNWVLSRESLSYLLNLIILFFEPSKAS